MTARINPGSFLIGGALIVSAVWLTRRLMQEGQAEDAPRIRDAGPENMRYPPDEWDKTDTMVDESFPASDAPATY
jgi:hypothetical protein